MKRSDTHLPSVFLGGGGAKTKQNKKKSEENEVKETKPKIS